MAQVPIIGREVKAPTLNTGVTVIRIEDDVRKIPTHWAEEATEEIMKFLIVTSTSPDPKIREQANDFRMRIQVRIFKVVEDIVRRAVSAEQRKHEKRG